MEGVENAQGSFPTKYNPGTEAKKKPDMMSKKPLVKQLLVGRNILLIGLTFFSARAQAQTPTPKPKPPVPAAGQTCVAQPVKKLKPNPAVEPAFYKGKFYYFCCENCRMDFAKSAANRGKMVKAYKAAGGK